MILPITLDGEGDHPKDGGGAILFRASPPLRGDEDGAQRQRIEGWVFDLSWWTHPLPLKGEGLFSREDAKMLHPRQRPLLQAIVSNRHCEDREVRGNPET